MTAPFLPEAIQKAVGTEKHTVDKIGESGSEVRVYANYVLKIQPHSPETDNEYQLINLRTNSHSLAVNSTHAGRKPLLTALRTDLIFDQAAQ